MREGSQMSKTDSKGVPWGALATMPTGQATFLEDWQSPSPKKFPTAELQLQPGRYPAVLLHDIWRASRAHKPAAEKLFT